MGSLPAIRGLAIKAMNSIASGLFLLGRKEGEQDRENQLKVGSFWKQKKEGSQGLFVEKKKECREPFGLAWAYLHFEKKGFACMEP